MPFQSLMCLFEVYIYCIALVVVVGWLVDWLVGWIIRSFIAASLWPYVTNSEWLRWYKTFDSAKQVIEIEWEKKCAMYWLKSVFQFMLESVDMHICWYACMFSFDSFGSVCSVWSFGCVWLCIVYVFHTVYFFCYTSLRKPLLLLLLRLCVVLFSFHHTYIFTSFKYTFYMHAFSHITAIATVTERSTLTIPIVISIVIQPNRNSSTTNIETETETQ